MSTSLLYHVFNLKGLLYRSTEYRGNTLILKAEVKRHACSCTCCKSKVTIFKGRRIRLLHLPPVGRKRCVLELDMHRLQCKTCGHLWWPKLSFMIGSKRFTRAFALTVLDLLQFSTIKAVAQYLNVGWDMVKNIHKEKLMSVYRKVQLDELVYLGIDEFSIRKGHTYMTIFVDLSSGRIIHAVEGRSSDDIAPFLQTIAKEAIQLKAVAIDMSNSYRKAIQEHLNDTDIVFDRYHISALVNRSIDNLRREQQQTQNKESRKTLKGSRFLLLQNYSSLDRDRRGRLKELLEVNQPLLVMHTMKEQLRGLWGLRNQNQARAFLYQWCYDALMSGVKQLVKIGLTLHKHRHGILSYFKHRITNGVTEGLNNKIKTLKRQVYGFRDMVYFKLRLYHLHTNRYALSG